VLCSVVILALPIYTVFCFKLDILLTVMTHFIFFKSLMLLNVCEEQFTHNLLRLCQEVVFFKWKVFLFFKEDCKCHAIQPSNTTIWNGQPQESGPTSP